MTTQAAKPQRDTAQTETYGPIVLRLHPAVQLTNDLLASLSSQNDALRLERNTKGELEILPPTHGTTGNQNFGINVDLGVWARADGTGLGFDSSTGFDLPNGSNRSPDVSWVLKSRLGELTEEEKSGFLPVCPDFVIEVRSSSDTLSNLQRKMKEYIENGARLGWLIDSIDRRRRVYIYRPGSQVEVLERPESISGEPELPGFILNLQTIWEPGF